MHPLSLFFRSTSVEMPETENDLRREVRGFVAEHQNLVSVSPIDSWMAPCPEFSRLLGARGWIGITWPKKYGGGERSMLERYIIIEELLAAGAPVGAHWIADRQSGPLLLRYGTEKQRQTVLPKVAKGECYIAIGMSEPNSGSDLASIRTRAKRDESGWRLNGSKIWTSFAQHCEYIICLCRTAPQGEERHAGLSQMLVDMKTPGITIRPIENLAGESHFNEIFFDDVFIPEDMLIGREHDGWQQIMAELAFERSGPERIFSTYRLLLCAIDRLRADGDTRAQLGIGRLIAHLMVLRQMSVTVAAALQADETPGLEASIVKDLGTSFEQEIPEIVRTLFAVEPSPEGADAMERLLADAIFHAPSFSLRGGTREILRSIIARGLGLR